MEEIFVPASGMAMEEVLLAEWLKGPGDEVSAGDPVAVVETDKATVELSASAGPAEGRDVPSKLTNTTSRRVRPAGGVRRC